MFLFFLSLTPTPPTLTFFSSLSINPNSPNPIFPKLTTPQWLDGSEEVSGPAGEKHIESYVVNEEKGWIANQIWGFAIIDGTRYYVRRVLVKKGDTVLKARLVYNWSGKK